MSTGGFGHWIDFRFPSLPPTWSVTGIEVQIGVVATYQDPGQRHDMKLRLLVDDTVVGESREVNLPLTYSEPRIGGVSDALGYDWAVEDINQTGFGVRVAADISGTGANLDYVTVAVYLQDPTGDTNHDGQADSADPDDDGDGALDAPDNCPTVANPDQKNTDVSQGPPGDAMGDACEHDDDNDNAPDGYDLCPLIYNFGQDDFDGDSFGQECDNCPSVSNTDQANFDEDANGDACDADDDNDLVNDVDEGPCGAAPLNAAIKPERLDTPGDDDGDTVASEGLPGGSSGFDCDGDGWRGNQENLIFNNAPGSTANDQDPCGIGGWPADLDPGNKLNIGDLNSFVFPSRPVADAHGFFNKFGHPLDDDGNGSIDPLMARWNLDTSTHSPATLIDIGDLNAINPGVNASTSRPPMFGGQPGFLTNGGQCPWPADDPPPPPPPPGGGDSPSAPTSGDSSASEEQVDQIAIDMGTPGPLRALVSNGRPAAGHRNSDGIPDAEGTLEGVCPYAGASDNQDDDGDTVVNDGCPGTGIAAVGMPETGLCGNGVDDDPFRAFTPPLIRFDGVADDGCVVALTVAESCIQIIDDGVLNADEELDADLAYIDVTVGAPLGIGGIPLSRPLSAWQLSLNWDTDVLDLLVADTSFLINAAGARSPFTEIQDSSPQASPFTLAVADGGGPATAETGPGVLSRLLIEGNGAGLANLTLTGITIKDAENSDIPIDAIYGARIAVSKDLDGDGVLELLGEQGQELYTCLPP